MTLLFLVYTSVYADVEKDSILSKKFVQAGVASWYGKSFHGKTTSNGEVFDMYAMTAAHNTLPHGLYVRVVNSRNGRETVVRINDRGPLISGRIIDLSYSAAKDLGMLECGLSPVTIEALGYQDKAEKGKTLWGLSPHKCGLFGIQVGAYSKRANAEIMAETIRKRHDAVTIHEAEVNGEPLFRVRVGKYTSMHSAKQQLRRICGKKALGGFVVALCGDEKIDGDNPTSKSGQSLIRDKSKERGGNQTEIPALKASRCSSEPLAYNGLKNETFDDFLTGCFAKWGPPWNLDGRTHY